MKSSPVIRPIDESDYPQWRQLWDGYNEFYGRVGATALSEPITKQTWERFLSSTESMHALVAVLDGEIVGLAHYLFHRSTSRLGEVCYLQDLFTSSGMRGQGVGRALILQVYKHAKSIGASRVYWTTQETNTPGRLLYDKVANHDGFILYNHELSPSDA